MPFLSKFIPFYMGQTNTIPVQSITGPGAPTANNALGYEIGRAIYTNTTTGVVYMLTSQAPVTWTILTGALAQVNTLQGDAGGQISPLFGNLIVAGTANQIATTGAGNTITWSIPATLTVPGIFNANAGTVNIAGAGAAANQIVNIATSAFNNTLTLGSATGTSSTAILAGTGDLVQTSTDRITLDSVGVLELNSSGAAIGIGNDANAFAINVGRGAAARTITLGNITTTTAVNVNTGTGGTTYTTTNGIFTLATGTGAINLGTDAVVKVVTIGNITGATSVDINTGTNGSTYTTTNGIFALVTGTGAINVGTDAVAKTLTIGNVTGATAVNVNTGTGGTTYTTTNGVFALATGTGAINLGTDAVAKTITVGNVTGATAVNVNSGTGACAWTTTNGAFSLITGTGAINLGADAVAKVLTIGNVTGATSLIVRSGTVGTAVTSTGPVAIVSVGASSWTNTGGGVDLTIDGVDGAVNITSAQTENDAILINASAANGGVQIRAGTGGILIGNEADTTAITLGLIAPTATRTITIGGGTVVTAAVTDTVSIGPDGATTNANSIKTVNVNTGGVTTGQVLTNIATGAVTSGTHTTSIASGNRAAGTMALNLMTGTGTKTVTVGNADGLTTANFLGPHNVTGAVGVTGNLTLAAAGNKFLITVGANASCGTSGALVGGTLVVATTACTANSIIFLTHHTPAGTSGILSSVLNPGVGFTINSTNALDTSLVNWLIIN